MRKKRVVLVNGFNNQSVELTSNKMIVNASEKDNSNCICDSKHVRISIVQSFNVSTSYDNDGQKRNQIKTECIHTENQNINKNGIRIIGRTSSEFSEHSDNLNIWADIVKYTAVKEYNKNNNSDMSRCTHDTWDKNWGYVLNTTDSDTVVKPCQSQVHYVGSEDISQEVDITNCTNHFDLGSRNWSPNFTKNLVNKCIIAYSRIEGAERLSNLNTYTDWSQLEYEAVSHQGWPVSNNIFICGDEGWRHSVTSNIADDNSNIQTHVSLDLNNEFSELQKGFNVTNSSDVNSDDSVNSSTGNALIHGGDLNMINVIELYEGVNIGKHTIQNKSSGQDVQLRVNAISNSDTDAVYPSPIAPNAPIICTELSFLYSLSQDRQILVNHNQADSLYSFNVRQQYLVNVSGHRLHDTKTIQYRGSFGKWKGIQTPANTVCSDMHIRGLSSVNIDKYVRSFGFMLLEKVEFPQYVGTKQLQADDLIQWVKKANTIVEKSGKFNYQEARIAVPSGLNIRNWRKYLRGYDISILCEYLEFGFPLNIDYKIFRFNTAVKNHESALRNISGVDKYFAEEVALGAMVGPLDKSPFIKTHYSPLMARSKPDGGTRVIVDLSWPTNASVNSCVPSDHFDFIKFQLKYPTIDNLVHKIRILGPSALLYKVDLQRAFRNLRIDPLDYKVLALRWRSKTYLDVAVPFGFSQGASAFQMATDAVTFLMASRHYWVMNYLDDIIGASLPDAASDAFITLTNLLEALGLPVNPKKVAAPTHKITCLGIDVYAREGTLSVPDEKLRKIKKLCLAWQSKNQATRNQLQSLIGHLMHIHKCIRPARLFTNRMLAVLRGAPDKGYVNLNRDFHKDILWFSKFLEHFNGTVKIHPITVVSHQVFVDASLKGLGGYHEGEVYAIPVLLYLENMLSIVHFEAANIVVALRVWAGSFQNRQCIIWCDNFAVVNAFNSHKIRDSFLSACVRTVWLLCAEHNIQLIVKHIKGTNNTYADILSRWYYYSNLNTSSVKFLKSCKWFYPNNSLMIPNFEI